MQFNFVSFPLLNARSSVYCRYIFTRVPAEKLSHSMCCAQYMNMIIKCYVDDRAGIAYDVDPLQAASFTFVIIICSHPNAR